MPEKYILYITQNYSFEILRPLHDELKRRGAEVMWLAMNKNLNHQFFSESDYVENSIDKARDFNPSACFVPGNYVPSFIPGLKVQVFHGLEWKKKGHFSIKGHFDLYCTHGKATTVRFNKLAEKHQYFDVIETGWPKLDYLFSSKPFSDCPKNIKTILYAPTFSPKLSSATDLYEEIKRLSQDSDYYWLVKFHPKMNKSWIDMYKGLEGPNLKISQSHNINSLLQRADIMVSDTSSVIGEFALLGKPIVSYKNSEPGDYLINIEDASLIEGAIKEAFNPKQPLLIALKQYVQELHPYTDGKSAYRIIEAVEDILKNGKKAKRKKPFNLIRKFKIRKKLKYYKR
jgi:CDP-glycerol glycerophosphotransferase (TagB/SpsB family)